LRKWETRATANGVLISQRLSGAAELPVAPQRLLSDGSPMTQPTPQHHLPRPAENGSCLVALAAAAPINLAININCFDYFRAISKHDLAISH